MKCKNPNCDGVLGWKDGKCKKCGTWRNYTSPHDQSKPQAPTKKTANAAVKSSGLRWLPATFYFFAVIGFTAWILIAINLESWIAFGYGIGSTIACLASGRVIELLQNIDDELYRKRESKQDSEYLRQLVEIEKFKLKRSGPNPSE